jgi:hypothetical protein
MQQSCHVPIAQPNTIRVMKHQRGFTTACRVSCSQQGGLRVSALTHQPVDKGFVRVGKVYTTTDVKHP